VLAGEYFHEACSTYTADRGPGLVDALRHAEELAREHGTAELWAEHSDRLARGGGRTARRAVEIALWALKREVRIRTIQFAEGKGTRVSFPWFGQPAGLIQCRCYSEIDPDRRPTFELLFRLEAARRYPSSFLPEGASRCKIACL
jgi:hypothetical protein